MLYVVGELQNTNDTLASFIHRGDYIFLTRQSKYHVPQNSRSTKIHLYKNFFIASFLDLLNIPEIVKTRFVPVRVVAKDL